MLCNLYHILSVWVVSERALSFSFVWPAHCRAPRTTSELVLKKEATNVELEIITISYRAWGRCNSGRIRNVDRRASGTDPT